MKSPVRLVFNKLHLAVLNIAPERKSEFEEKYSEFIIEYVDSHEWILHVTDHKRIRISSFVLEFLWATAYAHFVFYTRIFQGKEFKSHTEILLGEDPDVAIAMKLLKWAVEKLVNQSESEWPLDLPKPAMIIGDTSDIGFADEMALGAAACLLHHELAHIELEHRGGSDILKEKDADMICWEWVMNNRQDFDAKDLSKRCLLLSHSYTALVIRDIHEGCTRMRTHPRSIDRLFQLFDHFGIPENHISYAFTFASLYLHLENSKNPLPIQEDAYESFFESFDRVIDHISRFPTLT